MLFFFEWKGSIVMKVWSPWKRKWELDFMYGYVRHPPQNKQCMATKYFNMICFLKFNIQSTHIIGTQFPFITAILRYKFKGFEFSVWKCLELIIYVITTLKWFIQLYGFHLSILHSGKTNRKHCILLEVQYNLFKNAFYLQGQQLCSLEGPIMYWLPDILFRISISFFFQAH